MKQTIILILITLSSSVSAQTLTLEQVRQMASEHNSKAKNAQLDTDIAEQAIRQYRAAYLPDLSLQGFAAYGTSKGNLLHFPLSQYSGIASSLLGSPLQLQDISLDWQFGWLWHGGIQMKQPIYMGGRIVAANNIARHSLAMARAGQRIADSEIRDMADEAYINVVRTQELQVLAQSYITLLTELESNVQAAVDAGLRMPSDLLRVQVKKNEAELQLRRAQNGHRLACMNLNHVTGRNLNAEVKVETTTILNEPSADNTLSGSVGSQRPEAAVMQEKVEIARQRVKIARAEMLPSIALLATYGYTNGLQFGDKRLFDGADLMAGVTLSVPLYHFGERQAKIKQAKLRQRQAETERDDVNEQLQLALLQARNKMDEAILETKLCARSTQQANESMQQTRQQYEAGMATLSDLLDAQALHQQALQNEVEARCSIITARTALMKALGK